MGHPDRGYRQQHRLVSDEDPFGTNATGNEQIFSVDIGTGDVVQITFDPRDTFTAFFEFEITNDGSEVVFLSREDITGDNAGNVRQIFVAQTDGTGTEQVSMFALGFVTDVDISGDGNLIVFQSTDDLTGDNAANANQIFSITRAGVITQLTMGLPDPLEFDLSDDGTRVVFASAADPLGTNPDFASCSSSALPTALVSRRSLTSRHHAVLVDGSFNPKISDDGDRTPSP